MELPLDFSAEPGCFKVSLHNDFMDVYDELNISLLPAAEQLSELHQAIGMGPCLSFVSGGVSFGVARTQPWGRDPFLDVCFGGVPFDP